MKVVITLDFGDAAPASVAVSTEGAPEAAAGAARPTRGRKAAGAAVATPSAATPTAAEGPTEAASDSPAPTTVTAAAAQPATVLEAKSAASGSELTDKDVRAALVKLQTRKGSKDEPQKILSKYSPNETIGGLKKEDYAKVIKECEAVK